MCVCVCVCSCVHVCREGSTSLIASLTSLIASYVNLDDVAQLGSHEVPLRLVTPSVSYVCNSALIRHTRLMSAASH